MLERPNVVIQKGVEALAVEGLFGPTKFDKDMVGKICFVRDNKVTIQLPKYSRLLVYKKEDLLKEGF